MKKLYKVLAAAFAFALVLASPNMTVVSHAQGFNADAPMHDGDSYCPDGRDDELAAMYDCDFGSGSSDSGNQNSGSQDSGNHNEGNHDSGSSDSGSSDNGNHDSGSSDSGSSYGGGLGFNANAIMHDGDSVQPGTTPPKNPNDLSMGTTGGQSFRVVMNESHTSYDVYHCGIVRASFAVKDLNGNPVTYKTVALEQGEDNLWYVNITIEGDADPMTSYAVKVTKGDRTYLSTTLGVSGIKINGVLLMTTAPVEQ